MSDSNEDLSQRIVFKYEKLAGMDSFEIINDSQREFEIAALNKVKSMK